MTLAEILSAVILLSLLAIGLGDMVRQSGNYEARISTQLDTLRALRQTRIELDTARRMEPNSLITADPPEYTIGQQRTTLNSNPLFALSQDQNAFLIATDIDGTVIVRTRPRRKIDAACE